MRIYNIISIPKGLQEVECNCQEEYFSGYTAGYEDGKNKGFQSGYTSGVTDGIEEGKEEQKSLMVYTAITENGTYSREDGYNEIFVDVPSYSAETYASGYTDGYESGYTDGSENGFESGYTSGYTDGTEDGFGSGFTSGYTQGYSSGYTDGLNASGQSYESGYTSGYTDGYESGYTQGTEDGFGSGYTDGYGSGYTDGSEDGYGSGYTSGKTDGVAEQKAKLVSTAVTSNGSYSREDGFSSISVNVPQTGHTDEEIEEAFSSGKTAGVDEQKAKLVATAFTANGTFSRPDGFSSVYVNVPQTGQTINNQTKNVNISQNGSSTVTHDSNYTGLEYVTINVNVPTQDYWNMGFASGYTIGTADGVAEQKAKLTSTAFTQNGTYIRADGWSAVTVNVSGYTQQDLDNAFNSGWTNGYNSGYTDGYNDASGQTQEATALTLNVASAITGSGHANVTVEPVNARVNLSYTSSDPTIATVSSNGNINVLSAGTVTITVADSISQLTDSETITVTPASDINVPLTVEVISGGTILWVADTGATPLTIEYQLNDGNWTSITATTGGASIPVVAGDIVKFRGNNSAYGPSFLNHMLMQTGKYGVKGNIMSLIDPINYTVVTALTQNGTFNGFFNGSIGLVDASGLLLPATELTSDCYKNMFSGCTNLISAPALPATTLANGCYQNMFGGCRSLTTAPALPATTLYKFCYGNMFINCTSLTTAPELPATTLEYYCYSNMFMSCTSLTSAPKLPATALTGYCYSSMFQGCTNLTTAPELPATALTNNCYQNMFYGCTSLTTAPELPAPILVNGCYSGMFWGCSSLNYIKCSAISGTGTNTSSWVQSVAASGTFVKDANATWGTGKNGIPNNWTVQDA